MGLNGKNIAITASKASKQAKIIILKNKCNCKLKQEKGTEVLWVADQKKSQQKSSIKRSKDLIQVSGMIPAALRGIVQPTV